MPTFSLDQKTKLALAATASAAVLVGVIAVDRYSDHTSAVIADAGLSRSTGSSRMTDLLGGEVDPDEIGKNVVNLPFGAEVVDIETAEGFSVEGQELLPVQNATRYTVTYRNTAKTRLRFSAFIKFTVPTQPDVGPGGGNGVQAPSSLAPASPAPQDGGEEI